MALPPLYKYLDVQGAKLTLGNNTFSGLLDSCGFNMFSSRHLKCVAGRISDYWQAIEFTKLEKY